MLRAPGYCLLGMLEGFGLRAVRDALPDNPVSETEPNPDAISRYSLLGGTRAYRWCDTHGHGHRGRKLRISSTPTELTRSSGHPVSGVTYSPISGN